ncbi:MAG: BrnT family toxin [Deltaproteobacteria bacterium]|nr:BrnT family toxin [Deltaproteobacteria bacterium]
MDFTLLKGFEWDVGNIAKIQSRLDLATVEFAFHGGPYVAFDEKHSSHEKRWLLVNKVQERYIFIIFTTRDRKIRVISARYMRKKEAKKYEDWFKKE